MQYFQVHVKNSVDNNCEKGTENNTKKTYDKIPHLSLLGKIARFSIGNSCLSFFNYTNEITDFVIGYMGAPLDGKGEMNPALQTLTVRNDAEMFLMEAAIQSNYLHLYGEALGNVSWKEFSV